MKGFILSVTVNVCISWVNKGRRMVNVGSTVVYVGSTGVNAELMSKELMLASMKGSK